MDTELSSHKMLDDDDFVRFDDAVAWLRESIERSF